MSVVLDSLRKLEADTAPVGAGQTGLAGERGGHATGETPALKDDTISKLDEAVASWTSRVDEAYTRLAQRIARVQEHINLQTVATAARESETSLKQAAALEAAEAHVQSLTQEVAQREEEVAAATQRIAQLKDEAAELTSEVLRLQKALDEQTFAYAQQQEDLERVRTALASARDQLTAARSLSGRAEEFKALFEAERVRAVRIEEQLREKDKEAAAASQKVKVLEGRLDEITIENRKETAILKFEVEMLRRVNLSLSSPSPAKQETVREKDATEDADRERKRRMGEMLVGMGVITHDQLTAVLHEQTAKPQRRIGGILVERGYASEEVVSQVLARQMSLPFVRLVPEVVDAAAPRLINGQVAKRRQCIPITANADIVVLAMANPQDLIALDDVKFSSGRSVAPVVATGSDIAAAIGRYYGLS